MWLYSYGWQQYISWMLLLTKGQSNILKQLHQCTALESFIYFVPSDTLGVVGLLLACSSLVDILCVLLLKEKAIDFKCFKY